MDFLRKLANEIGLIFQVEYPASIEKPVVILSLIGSDPNAPSILLNSHMDVVPVFEEFWTHKPFDADIDNDGKIFARGAQDMKSVGMQYLGAIRSLMKEQVIIRRTFHVVFVPDEEIFGEAGMKAFVSSDAFKNLKIGFALDEGRNILYSNLMLIFNPFSILKELPRQPMIFMCFMVKEHAGVSVNYYAVNFY